MCIRDRVWGAAGPPGSSRRSRGCLGRQPPGEAQETAGSVGTHLLLPILLRLATRCYYNLASARARASLW
eukprot:14334244-Alexandrium_andersonii.AAC.1